VLHQLPGVGKGDSGEYCKAARERDATAKQGVRKYENPRYHQANRASSALRHMAMAEVGTRFAEAERKGASGDSEANRVAGAATREAAAQQGLTAFTWDAVALGAANTAAQHAQANAVAAKAAVGAKC
jgi:hypothetical protein